jgi:pyruvate formate lyase activating enzyme
MTQAKSVATAAGLRYVYLGNVRQVSDCDTTFCPGCGKAVIEREVFALRSMNLADGKCKFCGAKIAGVWSA